MNNDIDEQLENAIRELQSDDGAKRWQAGFTLQKLRDVRALEPLIQALDSERSNDGVTFALVELGMPALNALVPVLLTGRSYSKRNATHTIRQFWFHYSQTRSFIVDNIVDLLIECLSDADDLTRQYAVAFLYDIRDERAIEPLLNLIHDNNPAVRWCLIHTLESIGSERAIPALEWIVANDLDGVDVHEEGWKNNRDEAAKAILSIKGKTA